MNRSEQINELAAALAKAQGEIKSAVKDSVNPHFKSRYADLASVWEACRTPLSKNSLAVVQVPVWRESGAMLVTTLLHASGQWLEGEIPILPLKQDPQSVGSAITYARRYALSSIVGVAPDDDDGEAATAPSRRETPREGPQHREQEPTASGAIDPLYVALATDFRRRIGEATGMPELDDIVAQIGLAKLPSEVLADVRKAWTDRRAEVAPAKGQA